MLNSFSCHPVSSLVKCLIISFAHFKVHCFLSLIKILYVYISNQVLYQICFTIIFFQFVLCLNSGFHRIEVYNFNKAQPTNFFSFIIIIMVLYFKSKSESHSVMSDPLRPHELQPAWLLCPWNSPGQNTGVGSHSLLQGIFPAQGSNAGLLHCRWILYSLSHQGSPRILEWVAYPFSRGTS